MRQLLFKAALAALTMSALFTANAQENKVVTPNYDLAERFSSGRVNSMVFSTSVAPNWFRSGDRFWYSWKTSEGTSYYIVNPATGAKTEIFDLEKLAMDITEATRDPFDAKHTGIRNLSLEDDKYFTFEVKTSVDSTFHFKYDIASGKLDVLEKGEEEKYPSWACVSPDGTVGVYAKNHNLYLMDSTSLRKAVKDEKDSTIVERQLTFDGTADRAWGADNYKGDVERDSTKRHYADISWSPDSRRFATLVWDMAAVKDFWVIHSIAQPRPTLETYKYQMPGEPGPKEELYIFDVADGSSKRVKTAAYKDQEMGILRAKNTVEDSYKDFWSSKWLGDDSGFYLIRQSRDLKRLDICRVPVGADSASVVLHEEMNTYVEYRDPVFIKNGSQFIHWSERNGWANLYLYNADGTLVRNLTEGAFHVEDVIAVNEAAGYVLFSACGREKGENPYQMHTYKVSLSGGNITKLDMDDMDVVPYADDKGRWFVANYSRVDAKPGVALYDAVKGRKVRDLEEADFSQLFAAGYKFPERFKVKAADGVTDLYGAMYKPFDFDSTKVYPVADYVYPGPQVEAVNISWSRGFTRTDRLAQLGFIVVTVGNRGGHPNRSKWYHNYGYGNLRDYGLEDQKYAIQQLAERHSYMDINRVGIHGHSGGGFMSTAALLTYPDFFKVAVSCSGNHDNTIYNRWWSEQHHGIQEKVAENDTSFVYSISTNQELVNNLKGHLMLVTGDVDDNVNPAITIRMVDALIKANKRFDFVLLPGQRHGYVDKNEYFFWKMADFYCEWLMGSSRRGEVDIKGLNNYL